MQIIERRVISFEYNTKQIQMAEKEALIERQNWLREEKLGGRI